MENVCHVQIYISSIDLSECLNASSGIPKCIDVDFKMQTLQMGMFHWA